MANGLFEGALGGNLLKKRIARSGKVSVVACGRWWRRTRAASVFFVCGLVKNERSNIDNDKEVALKQIDDHLVNDDAFSAR